MNTNDDIVEILQSKRKAINLSYSKLSKITDIPKSSLFIYLNNKRDIPLKKLQKICDGLALDFDEVLGLNK